MMRIYRGIIVHSSQIWFRYAWFVRLVQQTFAVPLAFSGASWESNRVHMFVDGTPISVCHAKGGINIKFLKS